MSCEGKTLSMPINFFALMALFVLGCSNESLQTSIPPSDFKPSSQVVDLLGGPTSINTVQNATLVSALRIQPPADDASEGSIKQLSGYKILSGPVVVPNQFLIELRKSILDGESYAWNAAKAACGPPNYGVRFQFLRDDEALDILVCFQCDIVGIYHNGNLVADMEFDAMRPQLVRIAKALFPGDAVIQSLPEKE